LIITSSCVWASPVPVPVATVTTTTVQPYFPDTPPSCPICARGYPSINSCAQAAPALANLTSVIFNPGAFIDVIRCACTDAFQSTFPQCVDCFERTNQTAVLDSVDVNLPSLVKTIRQLCEMESSILGNASNVDGETSPSSSRSAATAASTGAAAPLRDLPGFASVSSVATGAVALIIFGASLL